MAVSLFKIPRLTHYSDQLVTEVGYREQLGAMQGFKPRGLWVSVDGAGDGWADWCRENGYRTERLAHVHDVRLVPGANIAHLRSIPALVEFSARFVLEGVEFWHGLDWEKVAAAYDGMLIEPYTWPQVWHDRAAYQVLNHWYYGWDCASGCIWNPRAVASISLVRQEEREAA